MSVPRTYLLGRWLSKYMAKDVQEAIRDFGVNESALTTEPLLEPCATYHLAFSSFCLEVLSMSCGHISN